jgi:membrane protein DedA with SNARE-associated domain
MGARKSGGAGTLTNADAVETVSMTTFLTDAGYWALIVFAFVQACCIPISSEITFGFAGVLAYQGHLNLALVIVIGTLAELAGSSAAYGLGRLGGRSTVERYRRFLLMTKKDLERTERFFAGRGAWSVAIGRVIPLVRAFTGLVSGFMEVPALPFELFNLLGTLVWAAALSGLGYAFGSDWGKVSKHFSQASNALAVVVVLMLVALIAYKAREVRRERRTDEAAASAAAGRGFAAPAGGTGVSQDPQATGSTSGPATPGKPHSHRRNAGS